MTKYVSAVLGLCLLLAAPAFGQPDDAGWRELQACAASLLNADAASFEAARTFRITPSQDQATHITIQLVGDQLTYFHCRNFSVAAGPNGRGHTITSAGGNGSRPLTDAEVRGFRRYFSLDPYWVLCHLQREYGAFTFQAMDDGRGRYERWEMIALADPAEKLYGVLQETAVVDLATHRVESYALLALDPDGVPLQDLLNLYQPGRATAAGAMVVTQTAQAGPGAAVQYMVDFQ